METTELDLIELSELPECILDEMIDEVDQSIEDLGLLIDVLINEQIRARKERGFQYYLRYGKFPK